MMWTSTGPGRFTMYREPKREEMRLVFLSLTVCLHTIVSSQETLSLKAVPFPVENTTVYIAGVLDERNEPSLGLQTNPNGDEVRLYLEGGAESVVKHFYRLSLPKEEKNNPIYIKIEALNIQESKRRMNRGIARIARAHITLTFLEKAEGKFKEVFRLSHNEDQVFELDDKSGLYATHEKRIRAALEYCMLAFLSNYRKDDPNPLVNHFKTPTNGLQMDARLGQWFNLITAKGMRSTYFEGYGISYTGFVDSKKGFIRPYETSIEVTWARPGIAAENGFSEVNSYVLRPELYFVYKRITPGVYAALSANIPIGFEILENLEGNSSFNFVIGAGASQGIRFIPWKKSGLVFGLDFFQQFETSKVYRTDLGFELVLGVNF